MAQRWAGPQEGQGLFQKEKEGQPARGRRWGRADPTELCGHVRSSAFSTEFGGKTLEGSEKGGLM